MKNGGDRAMDPESRRSFWLLVGNGAIVMMGSAFFSFETVMAGMAFTLTGSTVLVGLLTTVATSGWLWPQLIVGSRIEHLPRKMPIYKFSISLRMGGLLLMIAATYFFADQSMLLFWLILFATAIFSTGGGICLIPFMDVLAKSIRPQDRPMLMAYRRFLGGGLGVVAGLGAAYILGDASGIAFPMNYVALFVIGGAINSVAYGCFVAIREPVGATDVERKSFRAFLAQGVVVIRSDRDFRNYFAFRVGMAFTYMSQTLLVPFAMVRFSAPLESTGLFAASIALSGAVFSLIWGRIARRMGEVRLFPLVSALALLPCAAIAALALLPEGHPLLVGLSPYGHWVILSVFACLTAARQGIDMAGSLYMLAMPPADLRPTYFAFMNTLSAPLMLSPILAGWLAQSLSYGWAFGLSALAAVGMFVVALRLGQR